MASGRPKRSSNSQATAFQLLQTQLRWVDLIIEVRDARAPASSRHPQADKLFGGKPRLVVLAKEDLAHPERLRDWLSHLRQTPGLEALALALKISRGKEKLVSIALHLTEDKREALANKGLLPRPMRACVVGMPNTGKSSLINWLIGQKKAATGNRPGITRGPQWVRLHSQLELLDTPGILPTMQFAQSTALKLALLNLLPESAYDPEDVARQGIDLVLPDYPHLLDNYKIPPDSDLAPLESIAMARKFLSSGGNPDCRRAAQVFLKDLRAGDLGRITLDRPV